MCSYSFKLICNLNIIIIQIKQIFNLEINGILIEIIILNYLIFILTKLLF